MIGSIDPAKKEVSVIGAGISGLLIAYALKKKGYQVTVYEQSSRAGGLIQSIQTPYGLSETAAHSLLITPDLQKFFYELRVELQEVTPNSKRRFVVRDQKMRPVPFGVLTFFEVARALFRFFVGPKSDLDFKTANLEQWSDAYLGPSVTQQLLAPFLTGVYAATPKELNARLTFPQLMPTKKRQSLFRILRARPKKPRPVMMTPKYGMQSLVAALEENLHENIRFNRVIASLQELTGNLILCTPSPEAARLIRPHDSKSAACLDQVRYSPLVTITAFYKNSNFKAAPPQGVGVLIPRNENYRMLGCLFNSSAFDHRVRSAKATSLTVMIGGTTDPAAVTLSDEELKAIAQTELEKLIQVTAPALHFEITRWKNAIPVYNTDLAEALDSLRSGFCNTPGQILFNNYSGAVSIRALIESLAHI